FGSVGGDILPEQGLKSVFGWGQAMAPASVARASTSADSIKGLAQAVAKPAYRRLLGAEPALRRAVPLLIITFLVTMAVGPGVQLLEHRRQTLAAVTAEIEILADILNLRLDGATAGAKENVKDATNVAQDAITATIQQYGVGGMILVSDPARTLIA